MDKDPIVEEAIKAAGGPAPLARKLGLSRQAIYKWRRIPIMRLLEVEVASGIPRQRLRPDIFDVKK